TLALARGRSKSGSGARRRSLSLLDLVHERPQLARELVRLLARLALGVEVEERLVGIRQHLRPAALVEQLDPVGEVEVAPGQALVQHAHHETLQCPWTGHLVVDERRLRQLGNQLRQREVETRKKLEQVRTAR